MAKKYTRKHLHSMRDLDNEQERIRNKSRSVEHDFVEMINPQQLALTVLGNVIKRKIAGKGKKKDTEVTPGKASASFSHTAKQGKIKGVVKHPLFRKLLKKVGISFLKWQAFNLALFIGKKIFRAIKEKKQQKKREPATVAAPNKK
jgi:hypothetical protein